MVTACESLLAVDCSRRSASFTGALVLERDFKLEAGCVDVHGGPENMLYVHAVYR